MVATSDSAENVSSEKLELEPQARAQLTVLPALHSMDRLGVKRQRRRQLGYQRLPWIHACPYQPGSVMMTYAATFAGLAGQSSGESKSKDMPRAGA